MRRVKMWGPLALCVLCAACFSVTKSFNFTTEFDVGAEEGGEIDASGEVDKSFDVSKVSELQGNFAKVESCTILQNDAPPELSVSSTQSLEGIGIEGRIYLAKCEDHDDTDLLLNIHELLKGEDKPLTESDLTNSALTKPIEIPADKLETLSTAVVDAIAATDEEARKVNFCLTYDIVEVDEEGAKTEGTPTLPDNLQIKAGLNATVECTIEAGLGG